MCWGISRLPPPRSTPSSIWGRPPALESSVDPQIDQQIHTLAQKYDEAINKHDPAAVAALYTQDAVRVTALNNGTFHGR
jgi:hypothetical protein